MCHKIWLNSWEDENEDSGEGAEQIDHHSNVRDLNRCKINIKSLDIQRCRAMTISNIFGKLKSNKNFSKYFRIVSKKSLKIIYQLNARLCIFISTIITYLEEWIKWTREWQWLSFWFSPNVQGSIFYIVQCPFLGQVLYEEEGAGTFLIASIQKNSLYNLDKLWPLPT